MSWVNPLPGLKVEKLGMFDFPTEIKTPLCLPNVDPGVPLIEHLYGKLGTPPREQGMPCLLEMPPEEEDPNLKPWIDTIIDVDNPKAVIYHTGRLSGPMALELADTSHRSKVIVKAVPASGGGGIVLAQIDRNLEAKPAAPNVWYWHPPLPPSPGFSNELIFTAKVEFNPRAIGLVPGETYRLLLDWNFYHDIRGLGTHCEPFHGFEDSITFHVSEPSIV